MKYKTIYADPVAERGGGKIKRGADRHYPLMSVREITHSDLTYRSTSPRRGAIFTCG